MKLLIRIGFVAGAIWLARRLWPAVRTEPSTWLGEDWRSQVRDKVGV